MVWWGGIICFLFRIGFSLSFFKGSELFGREVFFLGYVSGGRG